MSIYIYYIRILYIQYIYIYTQYIYIYYVYIYTMYILYIYTLYIYYIYILYIYTIFLLYIYYIYILYIYYIYTIYILYIYTIYILYIYYIYILYIYYIYTIYIYILYIYTIYILYIYIQYIRKPRHTTTVPSHTFVVVLCLHVSCPGSTPDAVQPNARGTSGPRHARLGRRASHPKHILKILLYIYIYISLEGWHLPEINGIPFGTAICCVASARVSRTLRACEILILPASRGIFALS